MPLSGNDVDADNLTFTIVSPPSHGALSSIGPPNCSVEGDVSNCTATVTYTPEAGYTGEDSFLYRTGDGDLNSATATIGINVTNGVSYTYDELGRLRAVTDAATDTAVYEYDGAGNILSIRRHPSSQLSLIEFSPNSGPAGATVTIYGTGFSTTPSQNTVKFGVAEANVTSATKTQLVVRVPDGAASGPITVSTNAGTATSDESYSVRGAAVPSIGNYTPAVGLPDTTLTITGTNFDVEATRNKVILNSTYATVTSATSAQLIASVPPAATSGKLTVVTSDGKAVSSGDFFVPPAPYSPSDVVSTGRMSMGQPTTVTVGTANKIGLLVFDGSQGQQVSVRITDVTTGYSQVSLLRPDGTPIVDKRWVSGNSFIDTTTLTMSGSYTLVVDPENANTGSITFAVQEVPPDFNGAISIDGPSSTVNITSAGQNAKLTFDGNQNQRISIHASNATIPYSLVSVVKPDGGTLISSTWVNSNRFFDTVALPATGKYSVLIDPENDNTGSITFRVYDVPPDAAATATIAGSAVSVSITTPGQNAKVTFASNEGQRVSFSATNSTMGWAQVSLLKPDGTRLMDPIWMNSSMPLC